jgi:hypothetical protein
MGKVVASRLSHAQRLTVSAAHSVTRLHMDRKSPLHSHSLLRIELTLGCNKLIELEAHAEGCRSESSSGA